MTIPSTPRVALTGSRSYTLATVPSGVTTCTVALDIHPSDRTNTSLGLSATLEANGVLIARWTWRGGPDPPSARPDGSPVPVDTGCSITGLGAYAGQTLTLTVIASGGTVRVGLAGGEII